jgi:site-specific DNA-adenine methylase
MKYPGGKARNAKKIAGYINRVVGTRIYLEPFCGAISVGCAVIAERKMMSDLDEYMISMWRAVQNGWQPPVDVSEETYMAIRKTPKEYPEELVAFVRHACSFAALGRGYARDKVGTNYALVGSKGVMKKKPFLLNMKFLECSYTHWADIKDAVIYCDPPYMGAYQEYRVNKKQRFDSDAFWEQVKVWASNNIVFISEFSAPEWVGEPIHQFDCQKAMSTLKTGRYTENLYQVGIKE